MVDSKELVAWCVAPKREIFSIEDSFILLWRLYLETFWESKHSWMLEHFPWSKITVFDWRLRSVLSTAHTLLTLLGLEHIFVDALLDHELEITAELRKPTLFT